MSQKCHQATWNRSRKCMRPPEEASLKINSAATACCRIAPHRLVDLAMKVQLPIISDFPVFAKAGALFTFGIEESDVVRRTAYFVDRILRGAKPADLPVEQPTKFSLLINLRTAKALNISIPAVLLSRADEVIE
jgi:putative ABC transport system substrate-binding protein